MELLQEKRPQNGTERFNKVFTQERNRFVLFHCIWRLDFQRCLFFGMELNDFLRSRANTCKILWFFWNTAYRTIPFNSVQFCFVQFHSVSLRSRVNEAQNMDWKQHGFKYLLYDKLSLYRFLSAGKATTNGCSVPFGLYFPYKGTFTPSCNSHDRCYYHVSQMTFKSIKVAQVIFDQILAYRRSVFLVNVIHSSPKFTHIFQQWSVCNLLITHRFNLQERLSQKQCDNIFYRDMLKSCKRYGAFKRFFCNRFAGMYYAAVRIAGKSYYGWWRSDDIVCLLISRNEIDLFPESFVFLCLLTLMSSLRSTKTATVALDSLSSLPN